MVSHLTSDEVVLVERTPGHTATGVRVGGQLDYGVELEAGGGISSPEKLRMEVPDTHCTWGREGGTEGKGEREEKGKKEGGGRDEGKWVRE